MLGVEKKPTNWLLEPFLEGRREKEIRQVERRQERRKVGSVLQTKRVSLNGTEKDPEDGV